MRADTTFMLDAELDIAHAAKAKADLLALLEVDGPLLLDGSKVQRIDAAGIQLLGSLFAHCRSQQRDCSWSHSSDVLREAATGLGLAQALQLEAQPQSSSEVH